MNAKHKYLEQNWASVCAHFALATKVYIAWSVNEKTTGATSLMGLKMDISLRDAIAKIHKPTDWVHFATTGPDRWPHVTPMMMGVHESGLLFSITGQQKKRNLERDARACVSIAMQESMAHVIVWGKVSLDHDDRAQAVWERMIENAFGHSGLKERTRKLSLDGTSLGVLSPHRYRIYGL